MDPNDLNRYGVYQIYPISFQDSNHDGKGDLRGILSRLDYLKSIGVHTIWLSPIYASPMTDMGYDISDYKAINPMFGTMDDFDALMAETKKRGMNVLMDLVINHTSDQHPWFQEALKNPDSKYRDFYYFRRGVKGSYPNNWTSSFTGPAWTKVPKEKDLYYLHIFGEHQPDLNFHSETLIQEIESILRFWLEKGVAGFRCDVISCIYKESLEDGKRHLPGTPVGSEHYIATEGCHRILQRFRKDVLDSYHAVLIGECLGATIENIPPFLANHELDTFFSFEHANLNQKKAKELCSYSAFRKVILKWQTQVVNNGVYLENHDQHRSINKYLVPGYEKIGAKMLLTMIYTLKGVPFAFEGEEIGAVDYPKGSFGVQDSKDIVTTSVFKLATQKYHMPKPTAEILALHFGRDSSRAPMAFNGNEGHGFTDNSVTPWQKFNPTSDSINVENEEGDSDSVLTFYRKIVSMHQELEPLWRGEIRFVESKKKILGYTRTYNGKSLLVLLNLTPSTVKVRKVLRDFELTSLLLDNYDILGPSDRMRPYEAKILELK